MASWYVYSGAAGTGSGADWTNAKTTLAAAITAGAAGDTYYIAHDHVETQASALTLTIKGTITNPDRFLCVNRAGSVPPVAADLRTTASISTTGAFNLSWSNGASYVYGLTFSAASGSSNGSILLFPAAGAGHVMEACTFILNTTSTSPLISPSLNVTLINPTFTFGSVSQSISAGAGRLVMRGRSAPAVLSGGQTPTNFITAATNSVVTLDGLDLSVFGSGKTLISSGSSLGPHRIVNCKLNASVTIASNISNNAASVEVLGSNSTTIAEHNERYAYQGTLTTELTIVRASGASDGTTVYSWKIATTANAKRDFPFQAFEGVLWNDALGSPLTLTLHTVTDNVTLTDAEIWVEAEYLGSSGTPVATLITDAAATVLTAGANQTDDSGTAWTTTGLGTPVKQKLEVTFTPQMAGLVRWRVMVAKASATVYVDPKPDLA